MNKTKKNFMLAGSILGIVYSAIFILVGIVLIANIKIINHDFIAQILAEDTTGYTYTDEEISMILNFTKSIYAMISIYLIGISIAQLVISIIVLKQTSANIDKKGLVITLLVISFISSNILIGAFMIVALCLNSKSDKADVLTTN